MVVYGCKIDSSIDGGAPGYFIIGPFANKYDADEVTRAYNKLIDDGRSEEASIVAYKLNTFGYHEADHGHARTVEIPVYENLEPILNGSPSVAQAFNGIVKKHIERMDKIEAEREAAFKHIDAKAKRLYDGIVKGAFYNIKATDIHFPKYKSFDIRVQAVYSDGSFFDYIFYGTLGANNENGYLRPRVSHKCISKDDNPIAERVIKNTIYMIKDGLLQFLKMAAGQKPWLMDSDRYEDLSQLYHAICEKSAKCAYYKYDEKTGIDINTLSIDIVK